MKKRTIFLSFFFVITALLWLASFRYPNLYLQKIFHTFLALTSSYFVFKLILEEVVARRIREARTRYSFTRITSTLYILTFIAVAITIWVEHPQALLVSYGVLAAGAAVALQDFLKNFTGGIVIFVSGIYQVGDRIEVNAKIGDVIDIGILYTTLVEIRDWVPGDQPTGRLATIPNSCVLTGIINNYTRDHDYIWDEIAIPITYDSDWKEAANKIAYIVERETKHTTGEAERSISKLGEKYYLPGKVMELEPTIYLTLTGKCINFNVRYITEVRQRRQVYSKLSCILLEEIENSDKIRIAS